jgi:hypothetical protein
MKKRKANFGHPSDNIEEIMEYAENEIRNARTLLSRRQGAEMLYLALASSLERIAGETVISAGGQRAILQRLGQYNKKMPKLFAELKAELHGGCFHQARCKPEKMIEAVIRTKTFVRLLPSKLPR